jgi:hypothetical protein
MQLAGRIVHRGAQTEEEREAAEYIRGRLAEYLPDAALDDFHAIDNFTYLFASYYTEFLVVSVLAIWWPSFATIYGLGVFAAYLAEFMGFSLFSRLMPHFESQNVIARLFAPNPERIAVVSAHYDSGYASPVSHPDIVPWLRTIHTLIVGAMVVVLATCAYEAIAGDAIWPATLYVRWGAVGFLVSAAAALFYSAAQAEDIRGANNNASGVAALLRAAERLAQEPLQNTDVWFVATGSHESWMSGMRHLLTAHRFHRRDTFFLNLQSVGKGKLCYLTREGILQGMAADKHLLAAAKPLAADYDIAPAAMRGVPTELHIPLARGFAGMTVMALDARGLPPHWNWYDDRVTEVDESIILRASDFALALLRRLDADIAPPK